MILIAGATGTLGKKLVPLLRERGLPLRALVRDAAVAAPHLDGVDKVQGDVREPESLRAAMKGVDAVVSAVSGFGATGGVSLESVDRDGNRNLLRAARAAGVTHFVLVSVHGASADHPMDLMRLKFAAEQEVRGSGMGFTILRPTMSTETWVGIVGRPLLKTGKTTVFGRGNQPVNFVSARDVAHFVELALTDPSMRGASVEIGGPENLTMNEFVERYRAETGAAGKVSHFPLPVMRVMSRAMRPVKLQMARHIQAGVHLDTRGYAFDPSGIRATYPSVRLTGVAEVFAGEAAGAR